MVTAADKLACIQRELKMRRSVYPRWVAQGKMSQPEAARELEVMHAILLDYECEANQMELPL